jgi:hypothetical protein
MVKCDICKDEYEELEITCLCEECLTEHDREVIQYNEFRYGEV